MIDQKLSMQRQYQQLPGFAPQGGGGGSDLGNSLLINRGLLGGGAAGQGIPIDISSFLSPPPEDAQVNTPLIRAIPKRKASGTALSPQQKAPKKKKAAGQHGSSSEPYIEEKQDQDS
jgi:hypothetical protein